MKLVITRNITLDGVIEATDGWFLPEGDGDDTSDIEAELQRQMRDGVDGGRLELVDSTPYRSGVVQLTYRPTAQETTT
ncbi:hypothetical protein BH24ACT6_BH24ACT6_09100 [soil metagenome]